MQSSTSWVRSVSQTMRDVSTGASLSVASVITPVSPMPPLVAQNAFGVGVGFEHARAACRA